MLVWTGLVLAAPSPSPPSDESRLETKVQALSTSAVRRGWLTSVETGVPAQTVAFDWAGRTTGVLEVRARRGAEWGPWLRAVGDENEGPDPGSREFRESTGTGPVWLGRDVRQVEVRVLEGELPRLRLHAINSGGASSGRLQPAAAVSQPRVITRAEWGADESFRTVAPGCNGRPEYADSTRMAIVHHTATATDYQPSDGPALMRAIYYNHTYMRQFCDIGYNFLVDRFGQVFEGRAGGITQSVVGAHATGFNKGSTGVALIGTFTSAAVPEAMLAAATKVLSWKMALHGINPRGRITFSGRVVPALAGHRDVNATECPGDMGYGILEDLRTRVASDLELTFGPPRVGVINACSAGLVKEGPLSGALREQLGCGDARALVLGGDRVGVVNSCGAAYVKQGSLAGPFDSLLTCGDARAVTVSSDRIGVINSCGGAHVKEGAVNSPFRQQLSCGDARSLSLGGSVVTQARLGVINSCGAGYVKEGPLEGPFRLQLNCGDARAVLVTSDRVGVVNGCGAFYVKQGPLDGPFLRQTGCGDTRSIALSGARIAVINGCGSLYVKEGALDGPFNQQTGCNDAVATALGGDRVGVINGCGAAYVKEGLLTGGFNLQLPCGQARSLSLSGY